MAIYKEVDELLKAMDTWDKVPFVLYEDMVQAVTGTPHADVAPVVHAYWVGHEYKDDGMTEIPYYKPLNEHGYITDWATVKCSAWGVELVARDEYMVCGKYCPNCGAKMDGKEGSDK